MELLNKANEYMTANGIKTLELLADVLYNVFFGFSR